MQTIAAKAALKAVLPERAWRMARDASYWLRRQRERFRRQPPVGWVRFGSFRRVHPIDPDYGYRWGQVIDRYYIEHFIEQYAGDIHGRVLEVADDDYTRRFGRSRVSRSDVLHVAGGNPKATIIADLTDAGNIPDHTFDAIILTQTLQFIYEVRVAIRTLHRILKPGGVLLATCHGISQISRYDMEQWGEYWRFTSLSARRLFSDVFSEDRVTVHAYGNVLAATAFLHGLTVQELHRGELDYHDPNYQVILGIRAIKAPP